MTLTIECVHCCGSGQWPNTDGERIDACPFCFGRGGFPLTIEGKLARQLERLWVQQEQERQAALRRHEREHPRNVG